jgi:two-component system cell cycle response regulator
MSIFSIDNLSSSAQEKSNETLIMLVDDEKENLNVLALLLESNYEILKALSANEALSIIDKLAKPEEIKMIICDHRMPGLTGVEFFEKIVTIIPDTIRIILTGFSDTQAIIDSINKAKLYKFMTKPFDPNDLKITVQRGIEAFDMHKELIEYTSTLEEKVKARTAELHLKNVELEQALKEVETLSLTDQLTGANNRRFLQNSMNKEMATLRREHYKDEKNSNIDLGLVLIDIDHFKLVNDHHGHDAGDMVLVQMIEIIRDTCRESDWVIRWGGEEFLIVCRFIDRAEQHHLVERLRKRIENHNFILADGKTIRQTCSFGLTAIPFVKADFDVLSWQQTLNLADIGLYLAKNSGRNAWVKLRENNITDPSTFYARILNDLSSQISDGTISVESCVADAALKFD